MRPCFSGRYRNVIQRLRLHHRHCNVNIINPYYYQCVSTRLCTSNINNETNNPQTNNAELMTQMKLMQKQLNEVHKLTKKSKLKTLFTGIWLLFPMIVMGSFWSFMYFKYKKRMKELEIEKTEIPKVINITTSHIKHGNSDFDISSLFSDTSSITAEKLIKCIQIAKNDKTVLGISMVLNSAGNIGYGQTQELLAELSRFKLENKNNSENSENSETSETNPNKFILNYGYTVNMKDFLLSTVSDEFYLNDSGTLNIFGFSFPQLFFKNLLQKVGIEPYVLKREKYKSFANMFTETELTSEHRQSLVSLGSDLYSQLISIFTKKLNNDNNNKTNPIDCNELIDNAPYISTEAFDKGIITDVIKWTDYQMRLSDLSYEQLSDERANEDISFITPKEYLKLHNATKKDSKKNKKPGNFISRLFSNSSKKIANKSTETETESDSNDKYKEIALINISGQINSGESDGMDSCGSSTICELIRNATNEDDVISIVVRVDSPGGDAIASEAIWNELNVASESKPVVVSMGDVCASGGYYIASAADHIIAMPASITGSIGVVMMSMSINELLTKHLSITYDQSIKFGENSNILSPLEKPSESIIERYECMIDHLYHVFMSRVSEGRNMDLKSVREIAQGKVWTGKQALKNGLVDELGGLYEAKLAALRMADVEREDWDDIELVKYCTKMEKFMDIMEDFSQTSEMCDVGGVMNGVISVCKGVVKWKLWMSNVNEKINTFDQMTNNIKPYYLFTDM